MQQVDWKAEENRPVTPRLLGSQVYKEYDVKDVVDYIDWNPFFQVSTSSLGLLLCVLVCHCLSQLAVQLTAYHLQDYLPLLLQLPHGSLLTGVYAFSVRLPSELTLFTIVHVIIMLYCIVLTPYNCHQPCLGHTAGWHWQEAYPLAHFAMCWQECRLCFADMAAARKVPQPWLPQNLQ